MAGNTVALQVRIPRELHLQLKEDAAWRGLSLNALMVRRLSGTIELYKLAGLLSRLDAGPQPRELLQADE